MQKYKDTLTKLFCYTITNIIMILTLNLYNLTLSYLLEIHLI